MGLSIAHFEQALEQHLPGAGERGDLQFRRQVRRAFGLARGSIEEALGGRRHFQAGEEMSDFQQILHHRQRIGAGIIERAQIIERGRHFAAHHFFEQVQHPPAIRQPQHVAHVLGRDRAFFVVGDGLVKQRQGVARRAFGGAGDQCQGALFDRDFFLGRDLAQILRQLAQLDAAKIEPLAARQHRHRHFADFGGGENKLHMRRRLFQCLQVALKAGLDSICTSSRI